MAMFRWLILAACIAAPATAQAVVVRAPAFAAHCQVRTELVGFSRNERAAALRYRASCPTAEGGRDEMVVGALADVQTGRLTHVFFTEAPHHHNAGHRRLLASSTLSRRYPALVRPLSPAAWQKSLALGHFSAVHHDFADASVRLQLQQAAAVQVMTQNKALHVRAGQSVQLAVLARLADGRHVELALVQHVGAQSSLKVAYSRGGHLVAASWHDGAGHESLHLLSTPEGVRFASNRMGAPSVVTGTADEVESIYKALHPNAAKAWDDVVGEAY